MNRSLSAPAIGMQVQKKKYNSVDACSKYYATSQQEMMPKLNHRCAKVWYKIGHTHSDGCIMPMATPLS